MNKKLITLAVAVALAAPMAAQAGPKLYGDAHGAFGGMDEGNAGAAAKTNYVSSASSAWGIKGSDKLGNGMSAIYKFEWNVGLTGSNAKDVTTVRDRFVGVKAGWGTVKLGYFNTPHKITGRKVDLFFSRQLGENRALVGENGQDQRWQNVQYTTPKVNGLQGSFMYSPEAQTTVGSGKDDRNDDDRQDAWSAGVQYKSGNIWVGASVSKENDRAGINADSRDGTRLAGSYKMGDLKIVGMWQNVDEGATLDRDTWGLGAAYKMGSNTFKIQYYDMDETIGAANNGADLLSLGVDHSLGKKTIVYFTYAKVDNDSAGTNELFVGKGFDEQATAPTAGNDQKGWSLGMRHKF